MLHLYTIVEDAWFTKDKIVGTYFIVLLGVFTTIKPNQIHDACAIREMSHYALLARPHLESLETQDMSYHLHERHVASQLAYTINLRTIYVFIRVILEQVAVGLDAQFLTERLPAIGTYAW